MGALALKNETAAVEVLPSDAVVCQRSGCESAPTHLFRNGTVIALCEFQAKLEASGLGVVLPETVPKTRRAGGSL
jgi:hypothetical protein